MRVLLVLAACVLAISALPNGGKIHTELDSHWESFKLTYGKNYDSQYEFIRRLIWEDNLAYVQKHNLDYDMGHHTYSLGMNEFADLTFPEFRSRYLGFRQSPQNSTNPIFMAPENIGQLPTHVDWRTKGYVTPVKNQGQCGSCWSFSATGSLEGQHFRKTGKLVSLSEQNLVDCSLAEGNHGCEGGLMDFAFEYIKVHGIDSEESYPYRARDGHCRFDRSNVVATCTGYVDIPRADEVALKQAVATVGPISVAIDASHRSFQLYRNGVYNEPACSSVRLDHGVLAVGYGVENGQDYWLVKNSWGPSWGMNGYLEMSRNRNNQCGIATQASYPTV